MRRGRWAADLVVSVAALACAIGLPAAAGAQAGNAKSSYTYVGVKKCGMCHRSKTIGDQLGVWQGTAHSQAYAVLASDKAKQAAKALGIADPQKAAECLKCHATAFQAGGATETVTLEEGVSCESCHGAGSGYSSMTTMKGLGAGEIKADAVGLVFPPTEETCRKCHVQKGNPFYVEFNFAEAKKKIAHPRPPKN